MRIRKAGDRGHARHGWLESWHTFSFADYRDPEHMGFRTLRVINEDFVEPRTGFDTHPHRDMEIVTYVLAGAVQHQDSMGNGSVIRPGEVQRMTAGTGVTHSEVNPSEDERLHLLQIWIRPEQKGLEPGYEQKVFPDASKRGILRVVASRDGRQGSVTIHQDATMYATVLASGESVEHAPAAGRGLWVQVVRGRVEVNGTVLEAGDGAAIEDDGLRMAAVEEVEALVFDLG